MKTITLDFETYFDDEYTLKKLTTEEYIRDERFEALCLGLHVDGHSHWFPQHKIAETLKRIDWADTAVIAHHAHFDGLILSHHYDCRPAFWYDTLSMGRYAHGVSVGGSLAALLKHYELAGKTVPYDAFKGHHWNQLSDELKQDLGAGCAHDCAQTHAIWQRMLPLIPVEELTVIDMTVRMFTEPTLEGDQDLLGEVWYDEVEKKMGGLRDLNVSAKDLASAERFSELLRAEGVEPPIKTSPKGNRIYAFAKTDEAMRELLEDENPRVAALCAARLGEKSTIGQTRAARFGDMAMRGPMPVYLNYCGAHTRRWSGGDRSNWQNLRRGSDLRRSIKAPDDAKLGIVDLEQIECRVLNYLAGQWDVLQKFARKEDVYSELATRFYGRPISKKDPKERGVGKQIELSCGYGAGAATIVATARRGTYGPPVVLSLAEGETLKSLYRTTHPGVVDYWKKADQVISVLNSGGSMQWGPLFIEDHRLFAPNGLFIDYSTLRYHADERRWKLKTKRGWVNMWGGVLTQNVCELLSRVILSQGMLRIRELGIHVALISHDEAVVLIPKDDEAVFEEVKAAMIVEPDWLPGIPLAVEGILSERYEK
jgi:DNA polymerase